MTGDVSVAATDNPHRTGVSFALVPIGTFPIITASTQGASAVMSVSEITEPQRLSLTLDPGLVLERLILRRLSGLKRKRGQDWLRSLLVQGFLAEGQWIRSECPRDSEPRLVAGTQDPDVTLRELAGAHSHTGPACSRSCGADTDTHITGHHCDQPRSGDQTVRPSPQGDRLSP